MSRITISGNLADDPELRFTPSGSPVASFRVGVTERYRDNSGQWQERDTSWFSVQCWNGLAENVAESLTRGARVTVTGTMRQRAYETRDGEKRYVWDLHADEVGASLRYATVTIKKVTRGQPGPEDPWAGPVTHAGPGAVASSALAAESAARGSQSHGDGPASPEPGKGKPTRQRAARTQAGDTAASDAASTDEPPF